MGVQVKTQTRNAWAIHTQSPEGHGYIGIGYLTTHWDVMNIPVQCAGNRTALFRTRKIAREHLKLIKQPEWGFKKARVYRVQVTIAGLPA
jgi:hypothetical protein